MITRPVLFNQKALYGRIIFNFQQMKYIKEPSQYKSDCCNAPTITVGLPDFPGDKHACTVHLQCEACHKPCSPKIVNTDYLECKVSLPNASPTHKEWCKVCVQCHRELNTDMLGVDYNIQVYYCDHPDCPNYKLLQIGE